MVTSAAYKTAIAAASKTTRITGNIKLKTGASLSLANMTLGAGSLVLSESVRDGSGYGIGSFNTSQLSITIYSDDALNYNFADAIIRPIFGLKLPDETWESVPLGIFYVDGTQTSRKKDKIKLIGYDRSIRFDVAKTGSIPTDPYQALTYICLQCGVPLGTSSADFVALPNSAVSCGFSSLQVETFRDCVMWIAQLTGTVAKIDRTGQLILRAPAYISEPGTTTVIVDRTITANDRTSIDFSDTRTYCAYLIGCKNGVKSTYYGTVQETDPHTRRGMMELSENPIISGLTAAQTNAVYDNVAEALDSKSLRCIKANGCCDPAIETLDTLKFSGGDIDIGRSIIGVLTRRTWRYRQGDTLYCDNLPECDSATIGDSTGNSEISSSDLTYVAPKSQAAKQSVYAASDADTRLLYADILSDTSMSVTDGKSTSTYTATLTDGKISKVSDGTHVATFAWDNAVTAIDMYNAAIMALCAAKGLSKSELQYTADEMRTSSMSTGTTIGLRASGIRTLIGELYLDVEQDGNAVVSHSFSLYASATGVMTLEYAVDTVISSNSQTLAVSATGTRSLAYSFTVPLTAGVHRLCLFATADSTLTGGVSNSACTVLGSTNKAIGSKLKQLAPCINLPAAYGAPGLNLGYGGAIIETKTSYGWAPVMSADCIGYSYNLFANDAETLYYTVRAFGMTDTEENRAMFDRDFTLSFWFCPKVPSAVTISGGWIFQILRVFYLEWEKWGTDFSKCSFKLTGDGATLTQRINAFGPYSKDTWHFITVKRKNNKMSLYVDSSTQIPVSDTSNNVGDLSCSQALTFSRSSNGAYGYLDQIRLYPRALSDTEIAFLYNDGNGI